MADNGIIGTGPSGTVVVASKDVGGGVQAQRIINVDSSNAEVLVATAALQTTGNSSLASMDGKAPALVGGKVPTVTTRGDNPGTAAVPSSFTSITSATLQAANASRKSLTIFNAGAGTLYVLNGGGTASSSNYTFALSPNGMAEMTVAIYGALLVTAIFSSAGTALVQELT